MDSLLTFPAALPPPSDEYDPILFDNTTEANFDSGLSRGIPLSSVNLAEVSLTWTFNNEELNQFFNFYHNEASKSQNFFFINLAYRGVPEQVRAKFIGNVRQRLLVGVTLWSVNVTVLFLYGSPGPSDAFELILPLSGDANEYEGTSNNYIDSVQQAFCDIEEAILKLPRPTQP